MDVLYYKDSVGNFGDDLNEWLWEGVIPTFHEIESNYSLLGVGSIINKQVIKNKKVLVFGSGIAYGDIPDKKQLEIVCVRGKLTATLLNINESFAVTDTAILLSTMPEFSPVPEEQRSGIIFVPHHKTFENNDWADICNRAGIELINPSSDAKYVINKIRYAKIVIAEAMHAAIIADMMRVNWIPVVASHEISTFKWLDWLSTSDVEYNPIYIGLPDLGNEKLNRLKINYGVYAYKPAYQGLNALNLLKIKSARKLSFLQKRLFRLNLSIINHSRVSLSAQEEYQDNFVNKLIEVKNSSTYLSSDECFYRNLNLIKNKMDELLSFLKRKH